MFHYYYIKSLSSLKYTVPLHGITSDLVFRYMQQDLAIAKSLGDTAGECRAHGNLGSAYFSQGSYKEALTAHRYQLVLAMKCKVRI